MLNPTSYDEDNQLTSNPINYDLLIEELQKILGTHGNEFLHNLEE